MDSFDKRWVTAAKMRTICEVLREIYWETEDPVIRKKVEEATTMAKKMNKKLWEYKRNWDKEMWEPNPDAKETTEKRRKLRKSQEDAVKR